MHTKEDLKSLALHNNRIRYAAAMGLLLAATTILVNVLLLRWVVASLSGYDAGLWILAMTMGNYVLFFDLGFSPTVARNIGLLLGGGSTSNALQRLADQLATVRWMVRTIALCLFLILTPIVYFLAHETFIAWIIFLAGASFNLAGGVNLAILNGLTEVSTERALRLLGQLLLLSFSWIALKLNLGLTGLAIAWALQGGITRVTAGIISSRRLDLPKGIFSKTALKEVFGPSLRWSITSLGALLILQTGHPLLAIFLGPASLPSFDSIAKMSSAIMTVGLLFATSSAPSISHLFGAGQIESVKTLLFRNLRLGLSGSIFAAVFLIVFGDAVISTWLKAGVDPGPWARSFFVIMAVLEVHHVIWATATVATGPVPFAPWAIAAGVLNVILGILLIPIWGISGMALATLLAQLVTNNWYAPYFSIRHFKISKSELSSFGLFVAGTVLGPAILIGFVVKSFELSSVYYSFCVYSLLSLPIGYWTFRK